MEDSNKDLVSFRQQWRAEVSARSKASSLKAHSNDPVAQKPPSKHPGSSRLTSQPLTKEAERDEEDFIDMPADQGGIGYAKETFGDVEDVENASSYGKRREPMSALEHYERAVEREVQGNLGDSLHLYRKAFRLDSRVDLKYKSKNSPPSYLSSKNRNPNPSNSPATVPNTAHHSLDGALKSIKDIISGFSNLKIEPAPPEIEGAQARLCPIATLPQEILIGILIEIAILDFASYVRLARVCKRLAYLISTEEHIWKRVCLGSEFGFGAMHYEWRCEIDGSRLQSFGKTLDELVSNGVMQGPPISSVLAHTETLLERVYASSWQRMFRLRPRIRFNGCYISTVNYFRPGQALPSQITWNAPVLAVTYYRYLRFFRDGTVISLQTTSEPADVVHYLTKSLQESLRHGKDARLPSSMMKNTKSGRWRLSSALDNPLTDIKDAEGDVIIETEGIGKYFFRMELSMCSAGKGVRNNKLLWKGYWHVNKLSDDWVEFGLRSDKAFFWSRVKSYGNGA